MYQTYCVFYKYNKILINKSGLQLSPIKNGLCEGKSTEENWESHDS